MYFDIHIGEKEELPDKLRFILAQCEFAKIIKSWDAKGVPFSTYLYVPEVHPIVNDVFNEREDEGHVFKVLLFTRTCVHN